ncbi:MAG: hypothetical protein ABIQ64_00680 [Candidatus Saccharimonadales bacterium]
MLDSRNIRENADRAQKSPDTLNTFADNLSTIEDPEALIQQVEKAINLTVADYIDGRITLKQLDEVLPVLERIRNVVNSSAHG